MDAVAVAEEGSSGGVVTQPRVQGGAELERLYRDHYATVLGVVRSRLSCPDTAADVVQETFTRALQARAAGVAMPNPRAWLLRTARNLCVDHWRDQRRSAPLPDDLVSEERSEPESTVLRAAEADRLHRALVSLPSNARTALIMRDVERQSVGQIADRLGVTVGSASVILHRARGRARRAYEGARGLLMPPGLVDTVRRWVARTSHHGQPFLDHANAMCASACAAALVFAITAGVVQARMRPEPATVEFSGSESLSSGATAVSSTARAARVKSATTAGRPVAVERTATMLPGSPPGGAAPRRSEAGIDVPGASISASKTPPAEDESIGVDVDEEVAGQRIEFKTRVYDQDVGAVRLVREVTPTEPPER